MIVEVRTAARVSQRRLAREANVSNAYLRDVEAGRTEPTLGWYLAVMNTLHDLMVAGKASA